MPHKCVPKLRFIIGEHASPPDAHNAFKKFDGRWDLVTSRAPAKVGLEMVKAIVLLNMLSRLSKKPEKPPGHLFLVREFRNDVMAAASAIREKAELGPKKAHMGPDASPETNNVLAKLKDVYLSLAVLASGLSKTAFRNVLGTLIDQLEKYAEVE
ncbi:MAG: hypothetical protein WC488_00390 [Candidatus Micrarchaeia archaeon]